MHIVHWALYSAKEETDEPWFQWWTFFSHIEIQFFTFEQSKVETNTRNSRVHITNHSKQCRQWKNALSRQFGNKHSKQKYSTCVPNRIENKPTNANWTLLILFLMSSAHQTDRMVASKCERLRNGGRAHVSNEHYDIPVGWQERAGSNKVHGIG